jgi:hypothetical protein
MRFGADLSRVPRSRLYTMFGTVLYVEPGSGEVRHGPAETSATNALFVPDRESPGEGQRGWLVHAGKSSARPVVCAGERCLSEESRGETTFEATMVDSGLLALRAEGRFMCAEPDGRITVSRQICGPWEQFLALEEEVVSSDAASVPAAQHNLTKFHLGCGPLYVPGYLNIDWRQDLPAGAVFQDIEGIAGAFFLNHDLTKGMPGRDRSLDIVYHCHFLEHLPYLTGLKLLRQLRNRLKPGGLMRLLVPDLALWIEHYNCDNTAFFDSYRRSALSGSAFYKTKGSVFMGMLHNWEHRCGYDFETLDWMLGMVGFAEIQRTLFQESKIPGIQSLEPYSPLRGMESLCVECMRPYSDPDLVTREE